MLEIAMLTHRIRAAAAVGAALALLATSGSTAVRLADEPHHYGEWIADVERPYHP
jgi:hypothetical protein